LLHLTNTLQPNELEKPTIKDTALYRLPIWTLNRVMGRFTSKPANDEDEDSFDEGKATPTSSHSGTEDFEVLEKVKTTAQNGNEAVLRRKKSTSRK
jgi:hypothetical protein